MIHIDFKLLLLKKYFYFCKFWETEKILFTILGSENFLARFFSPNPLWAALAVAIKTLPINKLFLFLKIWEFFLDVNAHIGD